VLDRIVERRDLLREQADGLRKQLEDIDVELDQFTVAERVIASGTRGTRASPVLRRPAARACRAAQPGAGERVREHNRARHAAAAGGLAPARGE
jgi:hypothetical protein